MTSSAKTSSRPGYDAYRCMNDARAPLAARFARQILETSRPFLRKPVEELDVFDIGCGYGHTTLELARRCRSAVGIEPAADLFAGAAKLKATADLSNLDFRHQGIDALSDKERYDLIVLDNVFEHLPDQAGALRTIHACLRPGGAMFLLMPNKLWPIEVHYGLPFLSYLPLRLANVYLRLSGCGRDYTDASYAPTWFRLRRLLSVHKDLSWRCVLPADPSATMAGTPWHYRLGMAALRRFPFLWMISKAFLVVAVKKEPRNG